VNILLDNPMTQFSFGWILSLNWLSQLWGPVHVDPLLFEKSYYVAPEEKVSKPYSLFLAALTETKRDAIAKVAMHNREHLVLIRAADDGLILHTLYYEDELHKANKTEAPKTKFSSKELQMAKSLVEHLTAQFKLDDFHDSYRENVERLIEEKKKGEKITTVKQPRKAPVIDIMEALKRSLKSATPAGTSERYAPRDASTNEVDPKDWTKFGRLLDGATG
jgi:DNA end-binding protein Ku